MPTRATQQDKFANVAHIEVIESGTDTLTYKKLETGISLFEKVAWIIHRIEYYVDAIPFGTASDGFKAGVATSNNPSAIEPEEVAFVDSFRKWRKDYGTAANAVLLESPIQRDFSSLPGGGLIVPPNPIYLAVQGISQAGALTLDVRLYYTVMPLKPEDFWELVEARRIISST